MESEIRSQIRVSWIAQVSFTCNGTGQMSFKHIQSSSSGYLPEAADCILSSYYVSMHMKSLIQCLFYGMAREEERIRDES
jgi:hypothetical protein